MQGRTLGGCGGEIPPPIFFESVQNFSGKRKVGPRQCLDSESKLVRLVNALGKGRSMTTVGDFFIF